MATSIPPLTLPPPPAATTTPTTTTTTTTTSSSLSSPTSSSSSSSSSNKEKANHTRLYRLLVDIGRQVLQDVLDRIHPPSTLNAVLWSTANQKILKNLKTKKILYGKQWDTLFPKSGAVTSADFDITLLFLLLRNICKLKAPGTGWDKPLLVTDLSNEADLVRIKICRNELYAHIVNASIPDNEFKTLWDDIEAALLRLGGPRFKVQIQRVKHGALDEESELSFYVLTQCWEEGEKMTVDAIRELHETSIKAEEKTVDAIRELHETLIKGELAAREGIISINGKLRLLTAGGLVVTWAAGSGYLLHRHRDDPEKVIKLVTGAIIPSLFATVACVRDILPGSFKILVEIQSLEALDAIWKSYIDGDMKKNLEKVIVTDNLRSCAPEDVVKVDISLEISEDDYRKTRDYLLQTVLRNYWKACKNPSTTTEETSDITKQVKHIGICVKGAYECKSKSISFKPGKIEWKVLKELLTKATNLPVIRENKIILEISDPIDAIAHALVETSADLNAKDTQGETLLIHSAKMGAEKAVQLLVNAGVDVNVTDERGRAPLMYVVENGSLEVAEILMKAGADPILTDVTVKTSLFHAAKSGKKRVAQSLVVAGADFNVTDATGKTPLIYAVETRNPEVIDIMIKAGAVVNVKDARQKTPLMYAVETGNQEVVDILIKAGAEANLTDLTGKTSLIHAAQAGKTLVAQSLIEAGAEVNVTDARQKTPLMYAVETGHPEVVDILIKAGADVNMTDARGKTALVLAAEAGMEKLVQSLVNADANVNVRNEKGKAALMYMIEAEKKELVDVLVKAGADVNMTDAGGKAPLMYAVETESIEVVDILIKAGADVKLADAEGISALLHAVEAGQAEIVQALVKAGADVNVRDTEGKTALMHVSKLKERSQHYDVYDARKWRTKMVETLIEVGADVKLTDAEGISALLHAVEAGQAKIVQALVKAGADVNERDTEGKTALMHVSNPEKRSQHSDVYDARAKWRTKMVETLIEFGANVKLTDAEGKTALIHAVSADYKEIVQVLVKADADVNVRDRGGMTALMYSLKAESVHHRDVDERWHAHPTRRVEMVEVLLKAGTDVNVIDAEGRTALMLAVKAYIDFNQDVDVSWLVYQTRTGDTKLVEVLLKAGADVNVIDAEGRTALIYAVKTKFVHHRDMYQRRRVHQTRIGDTQLEKKTALWYASKSRSLARHGYMYDVRNWTTKVVEILIKAGADVKLKDAEGKTALLHAIESGNTDVEEVLEYADAGGYAAYGQSAAKGSKTEVLRGEEMGRQEYVCPMSSPLRTKGMRQKTEPTSTDLEFNAEIEHPEVRKKTTGPTTYHPEKERHQVETAKELKYDQFITTFLQDEELKESELTSYGPKKDPRQVKPAKRKQKTKSSRESRP